MIGKRARKPLPVATLTIRGAGKMTPRQRQRIWDWLMDQADDLVFSEHEGKNYVPVFTARLWPATRRK